MTNSKLFLCVRNLISYTGKIKKKCFFHFLKRVWKKAVFSWLRHFFIYRKKSFFTPDFFRRPSCPIRFFLLKSFGHFLVTIFFMIILFGVTCLGVTKKLSFLTTQQRPVLCGKNNKNFFYHYKKVLWTKNEKKPFLQYQV